MKKKVFSTGTRGELLSALDDECMEFVREVHISGGVRAAADILQVDPSVISRNLARAEAQLDTKLFDRLGRNIVATEAGRIVADYVAERRLRQANLRARMEELRNLRSGAVNIACGEGLIVPLICGPIAQLQKSHPNLRFRVESRSVEQMNQQLIENDFDLALSHNPPFDPAVRSLHKRTLSIDFIASPNHPLARTGLPVSLQALKGLPLALLPGGYGIQGALRRIEEEEGLIFESRFVSNTLAGLLAYVSAGFAATLMPAIVPREEIQKGQLVALPVEYDTLRQTELHLLSRHGRTLPPAVTETRAAISEAMRTGFGLR